jgi:hypothetical protein
MLDQPSRDERRELLAGGRRGDRQDVGELLGAGLPATPQRVEEDSARRRQLRQHDVHTTRINKW